ncbi:CIS tube protein [Xylanimonas cellulosilytica]|uniref:CIS tube protein n=1 Tax=Xylanimonas cellulosilytica TaxID=186189 RepID=UPI00019C0074|nr:peptidoglycan-binding protein [Xylanimonas cellulosilytica]
MAKTEPARFKVRRKRGTTDELKVQFNPSSLVLDKSPKIAELAIPGLDAPVRQFVRGLSEKLTVQLFFDSTEKGTGAKAESVTRETDKFYGLVKIDPETHASAVCTFAWNEKFPGAELPAMYENQRRTEFTGLVTNVKQTFSLFNPDGVPLRAVLDVTMEEYRPLEQQLKELGLKSSDHTRDHVVADGENLPLLAWRYLDEPARWRHLADANGLDDPRRLVVGSSVRVPPTSGAVTR